MGGRGLRGGLPDQVGSDQLEKIDDYIDKKGPVTLKEEEGKWLVLADREPGLVLETCDDLGEAARFLIAHGLPFSFWRH